MSRYSAWPESLQKAVQAIKGTPPDEMRWLTWKDIKDFELRWQPTE